MSSLSNIPGWPMGCFVYTLQNAVYFNNDNIGSNNVHGKQICKALGKKIGFCAKAQNFKNLLI